MLSVVEAQEIILKHVAVLPPEVAPLVPASLGLILAENISSDIDAPPFDKSMMDGYAVRADDLAAGKAMLDVVEEITAGQTPKVQIKAGQAARIMTGAPISNGADAVVMVERSRMLDGNRVEIDDRPQPGQNILPRGREMRAGDVILKTGTVLRPQEFGLLAGVGRTTARVHPAPRVAVLPTGDELVDAQMKPGPGQIRNSNGPMIAAQVSRAGGVPKLLDIARDNVESLRSLIAKGLTANVLTLSGGVSAGKLDLVPGVLQELGVQAHFHKVEMKPGKPMFFGTRPNGDRPATLVFGLPGNPVSSLVCYELFVRPALRKLQGQPEPHVRMVRAELTEDFPYRTDRPTYHPAQMIYDDAKVRVRAVPWFGSADLRGVLSANAFVLLPAGEHVHRAGERFDVLQVE